MMVSQQQFHKTNMLIVSYEGGKLTGKIFNHRVINNSQQFSILYKGNIFHESSFQVIRC